MRDLSISQLESPHSPNTSLIYSEIPSKPFLGPEKPQQKSLFSGPFSKGGYKSPALISPEKLLVQSNRTFRMTTRNLQKSTSCVTINRSIDVDPEIINEARFQDKILQRFPSKKLQILLNKAKPSLQPISRTVSKSPLKDAEIPNIKSYLGFLDSTHCDSLTSFSNKLHEKSEIQASPIPSIQDVDIPLAKSSIIDEILPLEQTRVPREMKTRLTTLRTRNLSDSCVSSMASSSMSRSQDAKPRATLEIPIRSPKKRAFTFQRISSLLSQEKSDETLARELSDELSTNYKNFMANAAKNKEMLTRVTKLLDEKGILEIMTGRMNKIIPLNVRIYRDMVEVAEDESIYSPTKSPGKGVSPTRKDSSARKSYKSQVKLLLAKYKMYQSVNKTLEQMDSEYRIQKLQYLEMNLFQAHSEFKEKRNNCLKNASKWDSEKYQKLKNQCERTEAELHVYDRYEPKDDFTSCRKMLQPESEVSIINKNLDDMIRRWKINIMLNNK